MYLYYFHVKFKRKYTLEQPSVLIICSAISLHLNTTTTGSGVKRNYTETGTWDEYDVIEADDDGEDDTAWPSRLALQLLQRSKAEAPSGEPFEAHIVCPRAFGAK